MSIILYRAFTQVTGPLIGRYMRKRLREGKEDANRFAERFGQPSKDRPNGPLIWIHAASVGESLSMISLITRLRQERAGISILITSGTVTSAKIMSERLPDDVIHQYVPVDRLPWVKSFLDHWQPNLVLWVESEFWPAVLSELRKRKVTTILMNARISEKSLQGWKWAPWMIKQILKTFDQCLAQTELDADRLRILGAKNVFCPGNLKFCAAPLPTNKETLATLTKSIGSRPNWIAYSTHPGEEDVIKSAHLILKKTFPKLVTIIVPRHPGRGNELAEKFRSEGFILSRKSENDPIHNDTDFLMGDTIGELGTFFTITDIAFVGGSLTNHGGQNPIEPARLNCALVHGPNMDNFLAIEAELKASGASVCANNATEIAHEVNKLLSNETLKKRRAAAAKKIAEGKLGILDSIFSYLNPELNRISPAQPMFVTRNARA